MILWYCIKLNSISFNNKRFSNRITISHKTAPTCIRHTRPHTHKHARMHVHTYAHTHTHKHTHTHIKPNAKE